MKRPGEYQKEEQNRCGGATRVDQVAQVGPGMKETKEVASDFKGCEEGEEGMDKIVAAMTMEVVDTKRG